MPTASSSAAEATSIGTSTAGHSTDETTTSGADSSAGESTGEAPTSVCDPQPEAIWAGAVIDGNRNYNQPEGEQLHECIVDSVASGRAGMLDIAFDCVDAEGAPISHALAIESDPPVEIPFAAGDFVIFDLFVFAPWSQNEFVTIRDSDGRLLLAYLSARKIPTASTDASGDSEVPPSSFFAPLQLDTASTCRPDCEEEGGDFIDDPCPCVLRLAIDFGLGDENVRVLDRGSATLLRAGLSVRVDNAVQWVGVAGQNDCGTDDPGQWYRFIVAAGS